MTAASPAPQSQATTGIEGLDAILSGGFTPNRLYLLEGVPGSGKTTIALQFLLEGVRQGEPVLYVTLSETEEELRGVAGSHGWSLDGITIRELGPSEASLSPDEQYTMFHPSEVELSETTRTVLADVERIKPARVVFDSLSEFRLLAGNPLRYRRQILALKQFFAGRRCTVLLLDDMTSASHDLQVQSVAHGVVRIEQLYPEYGAERRRLIVVKYRGVRFRGGYHDYIIRRGGIEVYPRLVAGEHRPAPITEKLASGIAEIDTLLGGGIERGTSTLIVGAAGTGKSSLAAQFVASAAAHGQGAALFIFDESINTLLTRMAGLGIDLKKHLDDGRVSVQQVDPAELSPGEFVHAIRQAVEQRRVAVVVIDSLNGYLNAMPGERFLIIQLHELLTYLGQAGVATLLIGAHQGLVGGPMIAPVDASYLADSVILMRYFETKGEIRQAISVVKKRGGAHERTIREFRLQAGGISVGAPLRDFRGVLTGVPILEGADDLLREKEDFVTDAQRDSLEQRLLVLAPTAKDAALTQSVLARAGLTCVTCSSLEEVCTQLDVGAGAVLLAEEVVGSRNDCLAQWLARQPSWSDLPVLVLARPGADSSAVAQAMDLLGNVTVLERPTRVPALVSAVRTALRARRRQYQTREHLAESERSGEAQALLAAIVASSDDAIISKTLDGNILSWNAGAQRLFGYTAEEAIGRPITLLIPPERQDEEPALLQRLRRGERIEHFETIRVTKDGRRLDISLTVSPVRDASGKIIAASKVARDITDRRRAEEQLRNSEAEARRLLELNRTTMANLGEGLYTVDTQGRVTYMNQEAERLFGWKTEELLGRRMHDLTHYLRPDGSPFPIEECSGFRVLHQGTVLKDFEDTFIRKDGSFFPVRYSSSPLRDHDGTTIGLVVVFQDVSERKRQAARQAKMADAALKISTMFSVAQPIDGTLRLITDLARDVIGCHQGVTSTTVDQNWSQAINAVSLSDAYEAWRSYEEKPDGSGIYALVCRQNKPLRFTHEELVQHPAWRAFGAAAERHPPLRGWLAVPLVGRDGRNLGLLQLSDKVDGSEFSAEDEAVAVQLAAMASVAIENWHLLQELRDTDRRKDEFLAVLAHELRNPLAPIRNSLHILRLSSQRDPTAERVGDMMERQVNHMVRLVDDLLEVSRITRGKIELRKELVEIAAVVRSAVDTSRPLIDAAGHQLAVSLPAEPLTVEGDPVRLAQVLANLLNNSAKYTDPGGQIWLTARGEGSGVVISVRDNGTGIPPELLPRVFELFMQIESHTHRAQGGLGIGLTLVKRLVEMHGGSIAAHSEGPGRGSEFVVRLPLVVRTGALCQPDAGTSTVLPPRRILVVDDNRDAAESLAMLLRLLGAEVHVVYNGLDALEALASYKPAVVLLDIGMPGMDGHEVARRIRQETEFRDVTLIALTGWGQEDDRRASQTAGFDYHLIKPADVNALQTLLLSLEDRPK